MKKTRLKIFRLHPCHLPKETQPILKTGRSSGPSNPNSTLNTYQKSESAGIGCGVVAPSAPVSDPASVTSVVENSETPNVKNTVENSNDSKAENEKNTV